MTDARVQQIAAELGRLESKFRANVVDAVQAWSKHVVDEAQLEGVSAQAKSAARAHAGDRGIDGFLLTLDDPTYEAVLRGADDRALRHELYESYTTRASDRGPLAGRFDNGPLIDEILALRYERARLLGLPSHAEEAGPPSADDRERLLLELKARVRPRAQAELEEVWKFAKVRDGLKGFRPWDLPYYVERLAQQQVDFSDRSLRSLREIEWALFDLRVHRDYVPADRSSRLRSHVLDALAQARREVSVLLPPPWDRTACSFVDGFGGGSTVSRGRDLVSVAG